MADNSALLASLLLGQKRRSDPIEGQRKYGENLMVQGASTAPLASGNPLEGLARALQGGIGGYFAGEADRREEEKGKKTITGLSAALQAKTPAEMTAALQGAGNDSETLAPILGQLLTQKMELDHKDALGDRSFRGAGGVVPGQQGAAPNAGGYQGTLGGLESSNNPQAVNPQSGAAGQYQFMPQTWAEVRKSNPDLNLPESPLQAPPQLQAAAEQRFREQNAKILQAAGIEPTPANLYLAHRAGAQGAQTILQASPDTPLSTIVPPEWLQQNSDMRTTAGQFVQNAGQRFGGPQGGQGGQPGPLTINMTPGQQPQGSQDGATMPPQAQPPTAPQAPQISPAAAELQRQAQAAYRGGDPTRAAALQQKAQETQATFLGEIDKEQRVQTLKQPQENISNEGKLRDDFNNLQPVKDYRKAATVFRSAVEAAKQNSKASDLNMVYAFATMMDPGSVVRDQESNMVIATAGASDRIKGLVAGLAGNSALGPEVKEKLLTEMGSRYEAYKVAHDDLAKTFTGITTRSGGNPQNVITPFPEVPYTKGGPKAAGADLRAKYGLE